MKFKSLFLIAFFISPLGFTDESTIDPASTPEIAPQAELNAAGKRRLEENKQIIARNIETSLINAENSQKNAKTLGTEIKSLQSIEEELTSLKGQYESFLSRAQAETEKNNAYLKQLKGSSGKKGSELEQRELWKKDTDAKMTKVRDLLAGLNKNLNKIQKKLQDLSQKKEQWLEREKFHQKTAQEFTQKKMETEKKLRGES